MKFHACFLIWYLQSSLAACIVQQRKFLKIDGTFCENSVIASVNARSNVECGVMCSNNPDCVSFTFNTMCYLMNDNSGKFAPGPSGIRVEVQNLPMTWNDAQAHCISLGGHLLRLHCQSMHDTVKQQLTGAPVASYWVDLSDEVQEGNWIFSDGSCPTYLPWYPGEPNGDISQNCVRVYQTYSWDISDRQCTDLNGVICQFD